MARTNDTRPPVQITEADLRRAWRECRLLNTTFDAAMAVPAMATTLHRMAECHLRRQQRIAEQQARDCKRAQANDFSD